MLREKKGMERMKGDRELEKLLREIPTPQPVPSSTHHQHYHPRVMSLKPGPSSYCNGFSVSDDGSSYLSSYDYHPISSHQVADPERYYWRNNNGCVVVDELGLTGDFQNMNLGDRTSSRFVVEPEGFRTSSDPIPNKYYDVAKCTSVFHADPNYRFFQGLSGEAASGGGFRSKAATTRFNHNVNVGFDPLMSNSSLSSSSYFAQDHQTNSALYSSNPSSYYNSCPITYPTKNDCYRSGATLHRSCSAPDYPLQQHGKNLPSIYNSTKPAEALLHHCGLNPVNFNSSDLNHHPKHAAAAALYSPPYFKPRMRAEDPMAFGAAAAENRVLFPQSVLLMKTAKKRDTALHMGATEDTYILQGRCLKHDPSSRVRLRNCHSGTAVQYLGDQSFEFNSLRAGENGRSLPNGHPMPMAVQPTFNSVSDVQGSIYLIAKDQHGCRFLQKKFEEGSYEDLELIFIEIIDRIVELMMNPFGNYLIQKLLDVCHEEQRMRIVHMVTREPGELVRISLNTHGTRVVQKLIETLSTQEQISLVVLALEPGFLDLIKDLNGNHVIQRCLQCLSTEDNKFIFDAAAKFCVEIATHRHGCCVLQRCIDHSNGEQRQKLIAEICANGLLLAQDPFGNYVVQYILEKKISSASAQLVTQFEEHFVHLSMQKFSSHAVEKCLKFYEESRPIIIKELLSVSHFEQVLQDQYANYVIQSALDVTKGALHDSLVAAVKPHAILRTNPYCKKIFSRGILKK